MGKTLSKCGMRRDGRVNGRARASRKIGIATISLAGALAMAGCSSSGGLKASTASTVGTSGPPESLKVTYFPSSLVSLPLQVAASGGFFTKNGLDVSLTSIANSANASSALLSGSVDLTLNANDLNLQTRQNLKQPVVLVAGETDEMIYTFIVRKDWPTPNLKKGYPADMKDLKGAKIGVGSLGSSTDLITRALLQQAGVGLNQVTILAVGLPATAQPALENGTIDAYLSFEPMTTRTVTVDKSAKVLVDLQKVPAFSPWNFNSVSALESTVKNKPVAIARFQKAMEQAQAFIADPKNDTATANIAVNTLGFSTVSLAKSIIQNSRSTFGYPITKAGIVNEEKFLMSVNQLSGQVGYNSFVIPGARG